MNCNYGKEREDREYCEETMLSNKQMERKFEGQY